MLVEIGLDQRERLADPQTGAPQYDDQAPEPQAVGIITRSAHHGDDLLDGWGIWRVAQPLVSWRVARVKARECGRRSAAARAIEQGYGLQDALLRTVIDVSILAPQRRERELLGRWTGSEDTEATEDAWALANAREAIREERR